MNIYIAELFILSMLCPSISLVSSVYLHNNYYLGQDDKTSTNTENLIKVGELIPPQGTGGFNGRDGFMVPGLDMEVRNKTLSRNFVSSLDENQKGEKGEEERDGDGDDGDYNSDDDDSILVVSNEPTKTYERVVLEGSKIRISCPHVLSASKETPTTSFTHIKPPENSLATTYRNDVLKKQKQFAITTLKPDSESKKEKEKIWEQRPIVLNSEHVKWFRNHVPLLNVNHFHHQTKMLLDSATSLVEQNTSSSHDESYSRVDGDSDGDNPVIKITELSQTSNSRAKLFGSNTSVANETMVEKGQIQNNLLTNSVEQLQQLKQLLSETKTSENANEYTKFRKRTNMLARGLRQNKDDGPTTTAAAAAASSSSSAIVNEQLLGQGQSSDMYINEFGELVINKVSQYFAGKYTCLAYHRQSEVLVDVLANSQNANMGFERALKLDATDQVNVDLKMASESNVLLSTVQEGLIDNSRIHLNSNDHKTGNGPIEDRDEQQRQQQSAESADNKLSILDQISDPNGAQKEDNFDGEAKSKKDETLEKESPLESLTNDVSQYKSRNGSYLMANNKSETLNRDKITLKSKNTNDKEEQRGEKGGEEEELTTLNSLKKMTLDDGKVSEEVESKNVLSPTNYRLNYQRLPAQIVKSEIIQLDDLKIIPGFLYTKQHLYCPIGHLQWKLIYPLVRPLCPTDPRMISSELRCYHLAWRLISKIVSESMSSISNERGSPNSCDNSILDILWFKDDDQLDFDTNGREKNANLNIKLINILEKFGDSAGFISLPPERQSEQHEGSIVENYPSLPISNLSSKWICPLRGRTIEIDGVRKDSTGRYTCALRMKISKLREIIQKTYKLYNDNSNNRQSHRHQYGHHYLRQPSLDSSSHPDRRALLEIDAANRPSNNDISCCNGQGEFSIKSTAVLEKLPNEKEEEQQQQQQQQEPFKLDAQVGKSAMNNNIETIKPKNSTKSNQSPKSDEEMDRVASRPIKTNGNHPLTKQIAVFKLILERRFSGEQWLEYMDQQLSRLQDPLAVIQSFSLLVAERPANSSELWSTITEASNAYTRRRLSDFKRLKRSLERSDQQQPTQSSDFKDVYTFNDKSSSSSTSPAPTTTTLGTTYKAQSFLGSTATTLLSSQLYDEQALRLNDFVNENYPMKIKSRRQGNNVEKERRRKFSPANEYSTNTTNGQIIDAIDERQQTDSSMLESKKATINELNLMPDRDDAQIIAATDQQESSQVGLLLNNANGSSQNWNQAKGEERTNDGNKEHGNKGKDQSGEFESDIGVGIGIETGVGEQTENLVVHSGPFNYVNERNLNPLYSYSKRQQQQHRQRRRRHLLDRITTNHRVSGVDHERIGINEEEKVMKNHVGANEILTRQKRSSISVKNRDYMEEEERDEVGEEGKTKELITQRGSSTINNERQRNRSGQKSREDNLQTNSVANWHPPVIDDLKEEEKEEKEGKMFTSYPKLDSSFTTINSNLNDGQYEEERERDDNDSSYIADEIRGDERTTLSFRHQQPAVAEINIISRTQEKRKKKKKKSVTETGNTSFLGHQERPVKLNSISYDLATLEDAVNGGYDKRHDLLPRNKSQQFLTSGIDVIGASSISKQATRASKDSQPTNNSQFSINKWTNVTNMNQKEIQVDSISQTGVETSGQQNAPSGHSNIYISSEPDKPNLNHIIESSNLDSNTNFNTLDESLMWSAGRYLYMHMKAVASSSMFGVEVGVEWSNERSNGSNVDLNVQDTDTQKPKSLNSRLHYQKSPAPFATIDVISGQNLYLECTAHALGRLPEVKWYKLVYSIPKRLRKFMKLARRIGNDLYWPLTELNLFQERATDRSRGIGSGSSSSFTCSQSTSIFDNLENQTFTVISSLQLGQYNDVIESGAAIKPYSIIPQNYNLYACIVDADVRHNYATLGVHLREKPSKIPFEISKRLHARSVMSKSDSSKRKLVSNLSAPEKNNYENFDLYRQNHIRVPLNSYWVPIHTEAPIDKLAMNDEFIIAPLILTVAIALVSTSLLALVYLTMRSYRNSNHLNFDVALNNPIDEATINTTRHDLANEELLDHTHTLLSDSANLHLDSSLTPHQCLCHLEDENLGHQNPSSNILQDTEKNFFNSMTCELVKLDHIPNDVSSNTNTLYQAHSHNIIPLNYMCHSTSNILAELPSSNKTDYSYNLYSQKPCQQILAGCYAPSLIQTTPSYEDNSSRLKVNMVRNPLDSED